MATTQGSLEAVDMTLPNASFWAGKRVLVTGHTGFKGSWLSLWLLKMGAWVHGLSLEPEPVPCPGESLFTALQLQQQLGAHHQIGDIRDHVALTETVLQCSPEVVLHLAAQPLVRHSYREPVETWSTNVLGTLHLLEALRCVETPCAVVVVTTDKVYSNQEWEWGYRESDALGGHDPYSASKAATELLVNSWRASFCGQQTHQSPWLSIATARAGNVIGGGDWAADRIVPDAIRAMATGKPVHVRHPHATRPWQHVLEPLAGYLLLAEHLSKTPEHCSRAYNFGPEREANRSVRALVEQLLENWSESNGWHDCAVSGGLHEAVLLHLVTERAQQQLCWRPRWDFNTTVARTAQWYHKVLAGESAQAACLADLNTYCQDDVHAS